MRLCSTCLNIEGREKSPFRENGSCDACGKVKKCFFFSNPKKEVKKKTGHHCPDCGEELESLHYTQIVTEYGRYYFESGDHDSDDSNSENGPFYSCPECDTEIADPSDCEEDKVNDIACED